MELEKRAPALLEMLFGEAAVTAWVGASGRLVRWCQAMEGWLGELKVRYKPSTLKQARLAWKRLMQEKKRLPWELREADFEAHSAWMAG